jgi:hypothetical protein
MKRKYSAYNPANPEEGSDDVSPELIGWPVKGATYNPASPGAAFDVWNANKNRDVRVHSTPLLQVRRPVSPVYGDSHVPDGLPHIQLGWRPGGHPSLFQLQDIIINMQQVVLRNWTGGPLPLPSDVVFSVGLANSAGADFWNSNAILSWGASSATGNWNTSGSDLIWTPALGSGALAPSAYASFADGGYTGPMTWGPAARFDQGHLSVSPPSVLLKLPAYEQGIVGSSLDQFSIGTKSGDNLFSASLIEFTGEVIFMVREVCTL